MPNKIEFYDHIPINQETTKGFLSVKDAIVQTENGPVQGLYVTVRATHSGRITGNNGLYRPSQMKAGADSMLAPYEKPVGIHHAKSEDPIGRIKAAQYVSLLNQDQNTRIIDALTDEKGVTFDNEVEAILQLADAGVLYEDDFEGLGYILSTGLITDKDAIQKIRDGRYQTVSITVQTDSALCSACQQDWVEGPCEHEPGEIVDGKSVFLITNKLEYQGWDFVNTPADELASIVAISDSDGKKRVINSVKLRNSHSTALVLSDSVDSGIKAIEELDYIEGVPDVVSFDAAIGKVNILSYNIVDKTLKVQTYPDRIDGHTHVATVSFSGDGTTEKGNSVVTEHEHEVEDWYVKDYEGDEYKSTHGYMDNSRVALLVDSELSDPLDVAIFNVIEDTEVDDESRDLIYNAMTKDWEEDAKLSTKKRNALPSSAFCGPRRSLPILDSAHVKAAKQLIDKYEGPGDKSVILASLDRKAKALGCNKSNDLPQEGTVAAVDLLYSEDDKTVIVGIELADEATDELVQGLYRTLEVQMLDRKLKVDTHSVRLETLESEATAFKEDADEKETQLKILREELQRAYFEATQSNEALADSVAMVRNVVTKTMTKEIAFADVDIETITKLSIGDLVDKFNKTMDELVIVEGKDILADMSPEDRTKLAKQIADSLEDGMTDISDKDPIDDPTNDDRGEDKDPKQDVFDPKTLKPGQRLIFDEFKEVFDTNGKSNADQYLRKLCRTGIINDEFRVKLLGVLDS